MRVLAKTLAPVALLLSACCLTTGHAASAIVPKMAWNATLPHDTANHLSPQGFPTADGAVSAKQQLYFYLDAGYNLNALNLTNGAVVWTLTNYSDGMQVVEDHGVLVATLTDPYELTGIDMLTGQVKWSTNLTATIPQVLYKGRYLTADAALNNNIFTLFQLDTVTGNITWAYNDISSTAVRCESAPDVLIATSNNLADLVSYGINISTGQFLWTSAEFWGTFVGCASPSKGVHLAVMRNTLGLETTEPLAVFDPFTGKIIRNVSTLSQHFHTYDVVYLQGAALCALTHHGFGPGQWFQHLECYDLTNGKSLWRMNTTAAVVQAAYNVNGVLAVLERDYATSGVVTLTGIDVMTGKTKYFVNTTTPYEVLAYIVPGSLQIGSYVIVNNCDGITAISERDSFNITGLGTHVRVTSIVSTDAFTHDVVLVAKNHGYRFHF